MDISNCSTCNREVKCERSVQQLLNNLRSGYLSTIPELDTWHRIHTSFIAAFETFFEGVIKYEGKLVLTMHLEIILLVPIW
jgi:hypothetical protein